MIDTFVDSLQRVLLFTGGMWAGVEYLRRCGVFDGSLRWSYIGLHCALGAGSFNVMWNIVNGYDPGVVSTCMVMAACCHLHLTTNPREEYKPPEYVRSDHTPFQETR